jgi:hypothetical protein
MGQEAGTWDVTKGQVLANLAEMLVRQLEARWVAALAAQGASAAAAAPPPDARGRAGSTDSAAPAGTRLLGPLLRALSCYASGYLVLDLSARPWRVLHMNKAAVAATGACACACACAVHGGAVFASNWAEQGQTHSQPGPDRPRVGVRPVEPQRLSP